MWHCFSNSQRSLIIVGRQRAYLILIWQWFASEEVTLQLIKSKCIPVLLYGLEACPFNKSDLHSLDFVINKFFMKLFRTSNIETVSCCQGYFDFALHYGPSVSRNFSFSSVILCISRLVRSVSVGFVILHIIALAFLFIRFVLNYYHSWWIKMSIIAVFSTFFTFLHSLAIQLLHEVIF